ncbi:heme A synthase [Capnocytophaga sp. ARDL2]|uniref:COX15/CtaA family protein n=1 Tax=Capnocytophaga sp. ARDL2 TaxID=3238809 RepID=UPI003557EE0E
MNATFIKWSKVTLISIYLVIIAGATVRMTGSGMGCPDWPKCFGYYIPPTEEAQLIWNPDRSYNKGQVIIKDEKLWVANENLSPSPQYNPENWNEYTKHDYAIFNVYHTWTEYINRLFGAWAGIACLVLFVLAIRTQKMTFIVWSGIALFLLGFNAWLGATVVFSVLNPVKITTHMIAALLNVAAVIYLIHLAKKQPKKTYSKQFFNLSWIALILTLIQIGLGTQVRQYIDQFSHSGMVEKSLWLSNPDVFFYIHRTFSYVILGIIAYLFMVNKKQNLQHSTIYKIVGLVILETIIGIIMQYAHFPFGTQALHLVFAAILFGYMMKLSLEASR